MKKLFCLLSLLLSINVMAEDSEFQPGQVITVPASELNIKPLSYVVFTAPEDSVFEMMPSWFPIFSGGHNAQVRAQHCARFIVKACGESGGYNNAGYEEVRSIFGAGPSANLPETCRAWRHDCDEIGVTEVKRVRRLMIENNELKED